MGLMATQAAYPIAIISFDRPHYLEPVLRSLKAQTQPIAPERIFLFQDGYRSRRGHDLTDPRHIEACVQIFRSIFPESRVLTAPKNLGNALNVGRAEDYVFDTLDAEAGYFFEDDLVLSPDYLTALNAVTALATSNDKIAYVAAYGNHHVPLGEQRANARRLAPMAHKWGFALTRRQFLAQRPLVTPYDEMMRSRPDQSESNVASARAYFRKLGYGSAATSQDGMRDVASCVLGTAKINTVACFGKYIGAVGMHASQQFYEREKFGEAELYPDAISSFDPPRDDTLDRWIEEARTEGRRFVENPLLRRIRRLMPGRSK
jgi:hypothetical protein